MTTIPLFCRLCMTYRNHHYLAVSGKHHPEDAAGNVYPICACVVCGNLRVSKEKSGDPA